jgi:hypothetical protein
MMNKFCIATVEEKRSPFIIVLTDPNTDGPYVAELIRELKNYPRLLMMNRQNFAGATDWSNAHIGDVIVFGDANTPLFNFDYRIESEQSFLAETKIRPVYDLIRDRKEWKRAIKKYAKRNNKIVQSPASTLGSHIVFETNKKEENNLFELFGRLFNPHGEETHNIFPSQKPIVLTVYKDLLDELDDITITVPKQQCCGMIRHCYEVPKKKNNKDAIIYVVHQTWVKIGLKAYDIYVDSLDRRFITVDGQKFWVKNRRLYNA